MKTMQSNYKSILFFSLLALLVGCSKNDTTNNQAKSKKPSQEALYADGWRKGTLHIEVDISQAGEQNEPGETSLSAKWSSTIKAVSETKVLLAPDLRPFVSADPIKVEDVTQYVPFHLMEPDANTILSSQANHNANKLVVSNTVNSRNEGSFEGKVNRVYLQSANPSLFGPGYDAYLKINLTGKIKTKEITSGPGKAPVVTEKEKDTDQEITFILHPAPNNEKLNDYPYLAAGTSEELKQAAIKRNMDTLAILKESYADTLPVQGDIRAGMKSEATQDKLEMTYEYTGNKQTAYASVLGVVDAATANPNKVAIKITMTVDK